MSGAQLWIGTPGENWVDEGVWRGHRVFGVKRDYDEWARLVGVRDEYELVMSQYGGMLDASAADVQQATRLSLQALDLVIAELRNDNLFYNLAPILEMDRAAAQALWLSRERCAESPFGGCLYERKPKFGDQCVFCRLHHR